MATVLEKHEKAWKKYLRISSNISDLQTFLLNSDLKGKFAKLAEIEELKSKIYHLHAELRSKHNTFKTASGDHRRNIYREMSLLKVKIKHKTDKISSLNNEVNIKELKKVIKTFKNKIRNLKL